MMNERIKELLNEACRYAYEQNPGENSYGRPVDENKYNQDRDTKFAELIVRECMNIADGQKKYVEDMEVFNEQDATWNKARIQQSQQIVDKIKQHFGVEE